MRDGDGLFNVTLKGVRDNDYFDGTGKATLDNRIFDVLRLTNNVRDSLNLSLLTASDGLTDAAQIRADEISIIGEESGTITNHQRLNGDDYDTVFDDVGKSYANHAENLDAGATSAQDVVNGWVGSASHYVNIRNPIYNKLGVGYTYYDTGSDSSPRYYWTQMFADSLNNPVTVSTAILANADIQVNLIAPKYVTLQNGGDTYQNTVEAATIIGGNGNDSITNSSLGANASIVANAGNDSINNIAANVTIAGGYGDDSIRNGAFTPSVISGGGGLVRYGGFSSYISGGA